MDAVQLNATARETGKKHARAARRNHEVPCVIYGGALKKPVHFQVPELALRDLIYTPETRIADITVDEKTYHAIIKTLVMHPVTDRPFHVDFIALKRGETLKVKVALQFVGQAPASRAGLVINEIARDIEVECLPKDIPSHIEVDLTGLEGVNDSIRVSDLELPKGVVTHVDADTTLVAVVPPMAEEVAETETDDVAAEAAPDAETDASDGDEG